MRVWGASKSVVAAALVAAMGVAPAASPRAAELASAGQAQGAARLVEVDRAPGDGTTVIVVEKTPPDTSAEWAYPERGLEYYPAGPGKGNGRWTVGAMWQIAPMFTANYRHGLGAGFSADARLRTIILYNLLGVGGQWAIQTGPFSLGLMAHVDFFLGTLGKGFIATSEFNSVGWGLLIEPGAKAGLQVASDAWLTLGYEAYFSPYQAQKLGDLTISPGASLYEGSGLTLNVEYSPTKQGVIYYGIALYNTRANYPLWFNVDYSPAFVWYLGFQAGYEF